MSQSLLFFFKEGIGGLIRARVATLAATLTVTISLILVGIFAIITMNLGSLFNTLRSRVELEVFLADSLGDLQIEQLSRQIAGFEGVEAVTYISKDAAALEFKKLFEGEKEDYFETLGYNPLPASYRVTLTADYRNSEGAEKVFEYLKSIDGLAEEDIVFRRELLIMLEKYFETAVMLALVVGTIVGLSALLLVSNNIRLIILSKQKIIETMKLVGATRLFIQMPLYIQGVAQGLVGGSLAAAFLYLLVKLAALEIPGYITVDWQLYFLLANIGAFLGLAGSYTAVRKYL